MWKVVIESLLVGLMTWIIGKILFNLSINKKNKKYKKPKLYEIDFAFFLIGVILCIINYKINQQYK
jgi:hypothetical protein